MSMQKSGNVAVFWDYENCPAPASTSGYAIANSISALARSFGSVKVFKAYLEISDQSRSSLRSELQSSGVSLVDCPHNGRKDVADKMILVDMLSYAIDNPAPSTIFLITGDRDFAYALSVLKNRHYRVVLVKRPDTHLSLTFQACNCFDWFVDVVHQAENPSSQAEQSPQQPTYHRQSDFHSNASASTPSQHAATEDPIASGSPGTETADIVHFLRDRISDRDHPTLQEHPQVTAATYDSPRQDREVSSSPRRPSFPTSRDSTPNSASRQENPQQIPFNAVKAKIQTIQSEPSCLPENTLPKRNSPVRSHSDAKAHTGKLPDPTKEDAIPFVSPFSLPRPAPQMTPNSTVARRMVHEETGKSVRATRPPAAPPMSVEELAGRFLRKEQENNISPISPSSSTLAISSSSSESFAFGPNIVDPAAENPKPVNPTDRRMASQTPSGSLAGGSTGPLDTPVVPPNFVILVEALQWQRSQGVSQPFRNVIAERISKRGTTYQKAGVSSFRAYSLLAEQAGIVEMGGKGGRDWIRLNPTWHSDTDNLLGHPLEMVSETLAKTFNDHQH